MIRLALVLVVLAGPLAAQEYGEGQVVSPFDGLIEAIPDISAEDVRLARGRGVVLKGLDKVSGVVTDLAVADGATAAMGRLEVSVGECRYPEDNPNGEAYAWLAIRDPLRGSTLFEGWMVASSPALNALDHPRYDVWVIRCTTA